MYHLAQLLAKRRRTGLLVILLLVLSLTGCGGGPPPTPDTRLEGTVEAMVASVETARTIAQTAEAKADSLQPQVDANREAVETAIAIAETAEAKAQTALDQPPAIPTVPTQILTRTLIPLDGGVAIAYQALDGGDGKVFYHVDRLRVYRDYASFEGEWASSTTVSLALVEVTEQEWQLFFPEASRPVADSIATSFAGWSEYTLLASPEPADGAEGGAVGEPGLAATHLFLSETPQQTIITSTAYVDAGEDPTISNLESALSSEFLSSGQIRKLLLVEPVAGETQYTLVVISPPNPSGGDQEDYWCENICGWLGCEWLCR